MLLSKNYDDASELVWVTYEILLVSFFPNTVYTVVYIHHTALKVLTGDTNISYISDNLLPESILPQADA